MECAHLTCLHYPFPFATHAPQFDLDEHRLARFLIRAEEGYPNNPYHNRMHAADVLRSTHVLATRGGLIHTGYCDDMALLASYLAAVSGCVDVVGHSLMVCSCCGRDVSQMSLESGSCVDC